MADRIEAFFAQVATQHFFPRLQDVSGICRFHLEEGQDWTFLVDKGRVTPLEGESSGREDCCISLSREDLLHMIDGQLNPVTAFLQGRIIVTGDIGLAQICMRIFHFQLGKQQEHLEGEKVS